MFQHPSTYRRSVCRVFFEPQFQEQCRVFFSRGFCGFERAVSTSVENNVGVERAVSDRFQAGGEREERLQGFRARGL